MELNRREIADLAVDDRIDAICDAFESAWAGGEQPKVEEFVALGIESEHARLFSELLLVDLEFRQKCSKQPLLEEYLNRFPQYADQIEAIDFERTVSTTIAANVTHETNSASDRFVQGMRFCHYELVTRVGIGASAEVWKSKDSRLQRTVALKLPRTARLVESELHRFHREGRAAAQLRHPYIVSVHDVGRDGDTAFIVSEYIDGENLRQKLKRGRMSVRDAAELCAKLAEALHHAHELGIVHRDLKPANVLVGADGQPYITDFGLAKWIGDVSDLTLDGQLIGTPAYMSPEQARGGAAGVDRTTDVYTLGVMLYELLSGSCPFQGDQTAVISSILHANPPALCIAANHIPRDLDTICRKAMEKDRRCRYPTAQEMAVDLRRFLRGEPIISRRIGLFRTLWRQLRRRWATVALLILGLCVSIAGIRIMSLSNRNYELQGFRDIRVATHPEGAQVALVPIDKQTGELTSDMSKVIHLRGVTPLWAKVLPGKYLMEATLPSTDDSLNFSEEYVTIAASGNGIKVSSRLEMTIRKNSDVTFDMIKIQISDERRRNNPLLPAFIYVDKNEISSNKTQLPTNFSGWSVLSTEAGKRIPSAAEYDAIAESLGQRVLNTSDGDGETGRTIVTGLSNDSAEWTTTPYSFKGTGNINSVADLREMLVLKGYGDIEPPPGALWTVDGVLIAPRNADVSAVRCRFVRSGSPRFVGH